MGTFKGLDRTRDFPVLKPTFYAGREGVFHLGHNARNGFPNLRIMGAQFYQGVGDQAASGLIRTGQVANGGGEINEVGYARAGSFEQLHLRSQVMRFVMAEGFRKSWRLSPKVL